MKQTLRRLIYRVKNWLLTKLYTMEVQTRNWDGELRFFSTLDQAFKHAQEDSSVWKISFSLPDGTRFRLVKHTNTSWFYEPILLDNLEPKYLEQR